MGAEAGGAGGTPRRFLALAVPEPQRARIAAATASLRDAEARLRPTAPEGWHLTLAYLGEVEDAAAERAIAVLRTALQEDAPRPAPRISVSGAGRFADRVLLLEVADDPPDALAGFVAALHARLREVGFELPGRGFRAHLTLARARGRHRVRTADVAALDVPSVRWQPSAVGLWASTPDGPGGRYVVEAEVPWPAPG